MPKKKSSAIIVILLFLIVVAVLLTDRSRPSMVYLESDGGQAEFKVEIASTIEERMQGLMHRTHLPRNRGMLFIYPQPSSSAMWMKNMEIPLDILFFDETATLIHTAKNVPPCTAADTSQCPVYSSGNPFQYVLEINAGLADELQIENGSQMTLPALVIE